MKIFLLDEVYEFAKSVGITDKIDALAKKMYDPSTIQSDLQSYYDFSHSEEYAKLIAELETKLKETDMSLYNILVYSKTQSYDVIAELLNNVKNLRDRFVLLDKAISYKISSALEYELLVALFCNMYTEVTEDVRAALPKYIHIAYFNYSSIRYCLRISTSGNVDIFDEYEKYMGRIYTQIQSYINSKDTLNNLRLEVRCAALQYILPRLTNEKRIETLKKIELLANVSTMDFDNKERSIGVIWTFERLYEAYFDLNNYPKFFYWVYKQFKYLDNALTDKEAFFDSLRYYNKNNITGFIISMRRFYLIQNLFPLFHMNFDNILPSDRNFISSDDLDFTLYDDYANKLVMTKFKTYVDTWYQNNLDKLKDLSHNTEMLIKCEKMVVEGLSEEAANAAVAVNTSYDAVPHPELNITPTPGTFNSNIGEEIGAPEIKPKIDVALPEGFSVNAADLARLAEFNNQEGSHVVMSPEELIEHEEERLNAPTETPSPTTSTETTTPVATPEVPTPPVVSETPTTETTTPVPPVPPTGVPPLPENFTVNEDELNSLTEEERAAMAAANEE
ncbi:MAG: hypothetical protein HXL57_08810 [Solobacterium sp.]|nr:hypothetical protein [Solobacterium sp.]